MLLLHHNSGLLMMRTYDADGLCDERMLRVFLVFFEQVSGRGQQLVETSIAQILPDHRHEDDVLRPPLAR